MAEQTSTDLTLAYRQLREQVVSLARSIDEETAAVLSATIVYQPGPGWMAWWCGR